MPTYYLYRHIRHDLNVPFYIGIGEINKSPKFNTDTQIYLRAFAKGGNKIRNEYWKSIVRNTTYDVEILFETEDIQLIERKEDEFIKLYGKIIDGSGTLANIADGGLHASKPPIITVPIYVYKYSGEFIKKYESIRTASIDLNVPEGNISLCAIKETGVFGGYQFFYDYKGRKVKYRKYVKHGGREICVIDLKTKIITETFTSILQFRKKYKKGQRTAYMILENKLTINGFKFCFKDELPDEFK